MREAGREAEAGGRAQGYYRSASADLEQRWSLATLDISTAACHTGRAVQFVLQLPSLGRCLVGLRFWHVRTSVYTG